MLALLEMPSGCGGVQKAKRERRREGDERTESASSAFDT